MKGDLLRKGLEPSKTRERERNRSRKRKREEQGKKKRSKGVKMRWNESAERRKHAGERGHERKIEREWEGDRERYHWREGTVKPWPEPFRLDPFLYT